MRRPVRTLGGMLLTAILKVPVQSLAGGLLAGRVTLVASGAERAFGSCDELVAFLASQLPQDGAAPSEGRGHDAELSPQQRRVGELLAMGRTNDEIARDLGIAEGTVRKHLERIYRRLGVRNRAEAVAALLGARATFDGRR